MANNPSEKMNDNIINLIQRPEEKFIKSPRYQSIHKERTKREIAKAKKEHKTLGVPRVALKSPSDFLKKKGDSKTEERKSSNHVHYRRPGYQHELPKWTPVKVPVASAGDDKLQAFPRDPLEVGRLNFRKRNVDNIKNLPGKCIKLRRAYTRWGDKHDLIGSGLLPIFIHKKNFGVIPPYLKREPFPVPKVKICQDPVDEGPENFKNPCRYIIQEEKERLLTAMKTKRAEIMKQFQCLPFLIDTVAKIKRKQTLEHKLQQIEKDMELLENHKYIYVYDDKNYKV